MFIKRILGRDEECHAIKHVLIRQARSGQHVQKLSECTVFFRLTWHFFRMATAEGGGDILGFGMQGEH